MRKAFSFFKRSTIRTFLIRFFLIFFLVEAFLYAMPPIYYQEWLAFHLGNLLTIPTNGIFLSVNGISFEISAFCTGLSTWGLWVGLLYGFSYPSTWKKLSYALVGLALISFINFFRLLSIVYVGKIYHFEAVDTLHTITWFIMSAFVFAGWYFWVLGKHLKTTNANKIASFLLNEKK